MDLLEAIQNDVLKQKEEEALNNFASVAQFREFISSTNPDADVSVSLKMCCVQAERLIGGHGTRVTLIDAKQRGVFEPTADALNDLTPLKRKPYLAQVTVWDARPKKGVFGKTNIDFQPGAVYKFCHVDGVGFFADIAKGNVEYERGNNDKIYEVEPPLKKRKLTRELASQPGKHKPNPPPSGKTSKTITEDVVMEPAGKEPGAGFSPVATRSKRGDPPQP